MFYLFLAVAAHYDYAASLAVLSIMLLENEWLTPRSRERPPTHTELQVLSEKLRGGCRGWQRDDSRSEFHLSIEGSATSRDLEVLSWLMYHNVPAHSRNLPLRPVQFLKDGLGGELDSKVIKLTLANSTMGRSGMEALATKVLPEMVNLVELNLKNSSLGLSEIMVLAGALPNLFKLQRLNLNKNKLGKEGALVLAGALRHMSNLKHLRLKANSIGPEGTKALAAALPSISLLESLILDNNGIGKEGTEALAKAIVHLPKLIALRVSNNQLGTAGAEVLAWAVESMPQLRWLDIDHNGIGRGGAWRVASAIVPYSNHILFLGLRDNAIGRHGAEVLVRAFRGKRNKIQTLLLSSNQIGPKGAVALASALMHMPDLVNIDLNDNQIEMIGGKSLAWVLPNLGNLDTLYLDDNLMGPEAAETLVRQLCKSETLRVLSMDGNGIGTEGAIAIVKTMQVQRKSFRKISMKRNEINQEVMGPHLRAYKVLCREWPVRPPKRPCRPSDEAQARSRGRVLDEEWDFRYYHGWCMTCKGTPVRLYTITRRKFNLWAEKKYLDEEGQCANGVCFVCHPEKDPSQKKEREKAQVAPVAAKKQHQQYPACYLRP